jgi:chromosome segregation protein
MKLSRLEILGFKSFPLKTNFDFNSGIVAIVGPNGCGKTNILEAIEWVLGEQNPFRLRGEKMEDFIFKGSQSHKPLNFAEVTAVIENDETLPISYQEVAITRRYYRSGESEYFINRTNVRRKDIVNLFLNTGLKAEAYSIFKREMIDTILSSTSKTRRVLFEEAAEIAKYKNNKNIALNKLELTNSDLVRVHDILEEVNRQWRSFKRQVTRAVKYNELKKEIKSKRTSIAQIEFSQREKELSRITGEFNLLSQKREELLNSLEKIEQQLAEKRSLERKNVEKISGINDERNALQIKKNQINEHIVIIEERRRNLEQQKEFLENENKELEEKSKRIEESIKEIKNEIDDISKQIDEGERRNDDLKQSIVSLEEDYVIKKENLDAVIRKREELREKISILQEQQISQTASLKNREELFTSLQDDRKGLFEEKEEVLTDIKDLEEVILKKRNREEEIKGRLEKVRIEYTKIKDEWKTSEDHIRELEEKVSILRSEANFLKSFLKKKEGYSDGVRSLNKEFSLSILPEVLETTPERTESLLGVLESITETVVLSDPQDLRKVTEMSEKRNLRIGLLLEFLDTPSLPTPSKTGIHGALSQFIEVKSPDLNKDRILSFFSQFLLVETTDDAIKIQKELPQYSFVTRSGDVLSHGILFTGKGSHRELIGIQEKITKNSNETKSMQSSIMDLRTESEQIKKRRTTLTKDLEKLNIEFSTVVTDLKDDELILEKKLFEKETIEKRLKKINLDLRTLETESNDLSNSMVHSETVYREEHATLDSLVEDSKSKEAAFHEVENLLNSSREDLNKGVILLASTRGEMKAKEVTLKSKEDDLKNIHSQDLENRERISSFLETLKNLEEEREELSNEYSVIEEKVNLFDSTLTEITKEKEVRTNKIEELNLKKSEITENEKQLYERISSINLEKVRIEVQKSNLIQKIKDEYGLELENIKEEISLSSKSKLTEELEILEERMRNYGSVNLMAQDDLERVEERRNDLLTHKTDLQEAQKDLLKTIDHIDMVAKEKFLATFNAVRENFTIIFNRLFGSGECDLILSDGDPLEADITIVAKPKHKKVDRLASLSSGERTLIAIALLFSFYLIKPSPICVLDEIDAPLDDANIKRFLSLLQEFKKESQLIIITHNKLTMESADYLYGITMSEPNVSTVASVKIS